MGGRSRIHTHVFPSLSLAPSATTTHVSYRRSVKIAQQPPTSRTEPSGPLSPQGRRVPVTEAPAHGPSCCPNQLSAPSLVPSLSRGGTSSCCSKARGEPTTHILSSPGPGPRGGGLSCRGQHCPQKPPALDTAVAAGMTYGQQVSPVRSLGWGLPVGSRGSSWAPAPSCRWLGRRKGRTQPRAGAPSLLSQHRSGTRCRGRGRPRVGLTSACMGAGEGAIGQTSPGPCPIHCRAHRRMEKWPQLPPLQLRPGRGSARVPGVPAVKFGASHAPPEPWFPSLCSKMVKSAPPLPQSG